MGGDDGEVKRNRVFQVGAFIPTILLLLCLTTKAYFKVEDEAACAGVRVLKDALTVYEGTLAFDLTGKRDPYEIIDFCADTVYEKGVSIVPLKEVA